MASNFFNVRPVGGTEEVGKHRKICVSRGPAVRLLASAILDYGILLCLGHTSIYGAHS